LEIFGGSIADELFTVVEVKPLTKRTDEIESVHFEVDVEVRIRSKRFMSSFLLPEEIRIIFLNDVNLNELDNQQVPLIDSLLSQAQELTM
jgi:hypothetical protein